MWMSSSRWTTKRRRGLIKATSTLGSTRIRVTIAGFGLSGEHEKDWLMRREALKVSQAMFPEYVGLRCIDGVGKAV